jgi:DNA-binding CsgD family transcriptional regulator/tetratricopeptide (TPR) repeat protein
VRLVLLERETELGALRAAVADASARRGSVVVIIGEAGIGKTSLVQALRDDPGTECRVAIGLCDDLLTRRTLGPFQDIARSLGGELASAVATADTAAVCDAVLAELDHPLRPTVLVLEDVHWADEATLDVLRYVGRRIAALRGVLVVTYRGEEIGTDDPLTRVLGALSSTTVRHVRPQPLSEEGVAALTSAAGFDTQEAVSLTAGNPFLATELARATDTAVPLSVTDLVRSRLAALPPRARAAVELLSVLPRPVPMGVVATLVEDVSVIGTAETRGLVEVDGHRLRFRHELIRMAIVEHLPVAVRAEHHRNVLEPLQQHDAPADEVLHHARLAGRADLVVRFGLLAAREAYRAGSHREAIQHQGNVLAHPELVGADTRALILEEHAWSLYHLNRCPEAVEAAREAVELRRDLGDAVAHARALCTLSRMAYRDNDPAAAVTAAETAVELAERTDDEEILTEARLARASLFALTDRRQEAFDEATAVLHAAQELGRTDLESLALNYQATCRMIGSRAAPEAVETLIRAVSIAREAGHIEPAARAYGNLLAELLPSRHPDRWRWYDEAIAFVTDHDLPAFAFNLVGTASHTLVEEGRWREAEASVRELLAGSQRAGILELVALQPLVRILVRQGAPDADQVLARAWEIAARSRASQFLGPIGAIRAERAFLDQDRAAAEQVREEMTLDDLDPYTRGELLTYLRRAGLEDLPAVGEVTPGWAAELAGDLQAAVQHWAEVGDPYERALALYATDGQVEILEAVAVFDSLGAAPAARLARQRLRELGVRRIPRGPTGPTRENPAGLTERQLEVAQLVGEGLTNAQIAERLVLSVRTVDHHVAAVLQKLGVPSRSDVAGVLSQPEGAA